jgi:hypothetical protein
MPDEPQNIKTKMLAEILADVHEGIRNYLDAKVPEPPDVSMPTDVDSATLVNGICAWYVLELFRPLAGLKLVQVPMYLGQLNTVYAGLLCASLEYDTESDAAHDFEVIEPTEGTVYYPGDLRVRVKTINGTLTQCVAEIGEHAPLVLDDNEGIFEGHIELQEPGDYAAIITGLFSSDDTASQTINFTISDLDPGEQPEDPEEENPEPPGGNDSTAFDTAYQETEKKYKQLMKTVMLWATGSDVKDLVISQYQAWKNQTNLFLQTSGSISPSADIVTQHAQMYEKEWPNIAQEIFTESTGVLENSIPAMQSIAEHLYQSVQSLL